MHALLIRKQLHYCDIWRSTTRLLFTKPGQEFKRKKTQILKTYKATLISELLLPMSHSMHLAYTVHLYSECIQKAYKLSCMSSFFSQKQYSLCILYIYIYSSINTSYYIIQEQSCSSVEPSIKYIHIPTFSE